METLVANTTGTPHLLGMLSYKLPHRVRVSTWEGPILFLTRALSLTTVGARYFQVQQEPAGGMGVDHRCRGAAVGGHQGCGGDQRGDRRGGEELL